MYPMHLIHEYPHNRHIQGGENRSTWRKPPTFSLINRCHTQSRDPNSTTHNSPCGRERHLSPRSQSPSPPKKEKKNVKENKLCTLIPGKVILCFTSHVRERMHTVGTQSVVWSAWLTAAVVLLSFSSGYLRSSFFHCLRWGAGQPYWRGLVSVGWTGWVSIESAQTERSHQCREARMPTPDVCTNIHLTACKMVAVTRLSYRWNCLFCKYQHPCCHFGQNRKHHTRKKRREKYFGRCEEMYSQHALVKEQWQ